MILRVFRQLLASAVSLAVTGLTLILIAALLGFGFAPFDLLNHGQLVFLAGLVPAILLAAIVMQRGPTKILIMGIGLVGLLSSAITVVPEGLRAMAGRPDTSAETLRIMTYNFNTRYGEVADNLIPVDEVDPDILVLQEYWTWTRDRLHDDLIERFPYFLVCHGGKRRNVAIYAKRPFEPVNGQDCVHPPGQETRMTWIMVEMQDDAGAPFTVITTHFDWPVPIQRQADQRALLANLIRDIDTPVLLAGDFNSTSFSYALRQFSVDAGLERQTQFLTSFPSRIMRRYLFAPFPILPIDHVMTRGLIVPEVARAPSSGASDHYPVYADFALASELAAQ